MRSTIQHWNRMQFVRGLASFPMLALSFPLNACPATIRSHHVLSDSSINHPTSPRFPHLIKNLLIDIFLPTLNACISLMVGLRWDVINYVSFRTKTNDTCEEPRHVPTLDLCLTDMPVEYLDWRVDWWQCVNFFSGDNPALSIRPSLCILRQSVVEIWHTGLKTTWFHAWMVHVCLLGARRGRAENANYIHNVLLNLVARCPLMESN